ncbi:hypothetical protein VIGAN_08195700 [Vigna angularis var. angularis]|uniref:Uncharacterized protein n=1 Tax=Vigna angularis var. angularis TaxID=157739 RepID=A0A0S3SR11_PHAAN|nr:hypothetical protein VIGAN_08195700 [Vigna angularis var. angularis]
MHLSIPTSPLSASSRVTFASASIISLTSISAHLILCLYSLHFKTLIPYRYLEEKLLKALLKSLLCSERTSFQ